MNGDIKSEYGGLLEQSVRFFGVLGTLLIVLWLTGSFDDKADQKSEDDRAAFRADIMAQLANERSERKELENEIKQIRDENLALREAYSELRVQFLSFQSFRQSLPWPAWFKDTSGKVLFANTAYEQKYLIPRGHTLLDYVGGTDFDVWPDEVAQAFRDNDREVMALGIGGFRVFIEPMPIGATERFAKYNVYRDNILVGVAGMELPE